MTTKGLILVTGGSGFVASHCIVLALRDGWQVRTTVRSITRADDVRQMLQVGGVTVDQANSVDFTAANLIEDEGWVEACKDCVYVLHVASPFPSKVPKHEDDLIIPAREGTLRVLKAAKAAGTVQRVVLTSSFAAIGYGHAVRGPGELFTEKDWTVLDHPTTAVPPYQKSKTIAERAAWEWMEKEGGEMELAVVNPVGIFGPILSTGYAASIELVARLMNGSMPGVPDVTFGVVDVRDVADLHLRAMKDPQAKGERFIGCAANCSMKDIATILKDRLGDKATKVPTRMLPSWLLRIVGYFDPQVGMLALELGKVKDCNSQKAREILRWQMRSVEDALIDTVESLEQFGLIK